jgi:hypothetical protein
MSETRSQGSWFPPDATPARGETVCLATIEKELSGTDGTPRSQEGAPRGRSTAGGA